MKYDLTVIGPSFFQHCQIKTVDVSLYERFSVRKVMALETLMKLKTKKDFSNLSFDEWDSYHYLPCFNKESNEIFDIYRFSLYMKDEPSVKREIYVVISILPGKEKNCVLKGVSIPLVLTELDFEWLNKPSCWHLWNE